MSDYNWCHGPNCHERKTTTRVRGVKGSKVLRTKKIPMNHWNKNCTWEYFCDQTCLHDFINKHYLEMVRMYPRTAALETPVEVIKETVDTPYWGRRVETRIKEVDNSEQVG